MVSITLGAADINMAKPFRGLHDLKDRQICQHIMTKEQVKLHNKLSGKKCGRRTLTPSKAGREAFIKEVSFDWGLEQLISERDWPGKEWNEAIGRRENNRYTG